MTVPTLTGPRATALRIALCGGYFLVLLDVTVVNVALPQIGSSLDAGAAGRAWVVDAYTVPLAALLLVAGAVGDRIGHRRVVVTGFLGFGLASVLCGAAPGLTMLAVGRLVQGAAAALMLPGTLALLVDTAGDESQRPRLVGLWAAVGGSALPAGPLLGGLLVEAAGWRAVFWLNVPVILAALVPVLGIAQRYDDRAGTRTHVDWRGGALLAVLVGSAVTAILEVRSRPIASACAAAVALLAFLLLRVVERRADPPLLEVPTAARRPLLAASGVAGLMNLCTIGSLFLLTQVFQDVHRTGPLTAGLVMLPAMVPLPLLGAPAGRLVQRFGSWRTAAAGLGVAAVGLVGMAASIKQPVYPALLPALTLWGIGLGVLTPAIVTAALDALPGAPGVASGASNTARQTGGALGVAIFSALAGGSAAAGFSGRTAAVLVGSALAFVLAGAGALARGRRSG
ncbi:MFS transporter, DHA2 family, methylenomycin A resistance protein [Nocardioides terrae]|uniref:MFS transporter, DHA2 family, methylenomycin A resistance protein n=1 Tax=Nocardioides terrae TaxID=574651 RepID=A0A1I1JQ07_9ACTN|nr:MFS transporter [Nocardioides terrae]SFC50709.1 MFS transporter, DHA2 family, methylenomycin A resistance protein [Nocardioides terrae]